MRSTHPSCGTDPKPGWWIPQTVAAAQPGRATVSLQLEQFQDLSRPPIAALAIEVNGDEQFTHLTIAEARILYEHLGTVIAQTTADMA